MKSLRGSILVLILFVVFIFGCDYINPKKDQNELLKLLIIAQSVQTTSSLSLSPSTCIYQRSEEEL